MINLAYAAQPVAPTGGGFMNFVPMLLIFAVLYFVLYLPQRKRMKQHQNILSKLKHGDRIVTSSGLYGTITGLTDKVVTLEVADDVRIKVARVQVAALASSE
jgi:preprotein translocase subunit YajC